VKNASQSAAPGEGGIREDVTAALQSLADRGIIFPKSDWAGAPPNGYRLPEIVATRLPAVPGFLPVLKEEQARTAQKRYLAGSGARRVDMLTMFQIIVREMKQGHLGLRMTQVPPDDMVVSLPGWRIAADAPRGMKTAQTDQPVVPYGFPLSKAAQAHLAEVTHCPVAAVEFALHLMLVLGILERDRSAAIDTGVENEEEPGRLVAREENLWALLSMPAGERLRYLTQSWLAMHPSFDLRAIAGEHASLELHIGAHQGWWQQPVPRVDAVRRMLARIIGRMAPVSGETVAPWYDFDSLLRFLWSTASRLLVAPTTNGNRHSWSFAQRLPATGTAKSKDHKVRKSADAGQEQSKRLNLTHHEDWKQVWEPLVVSMLNGPLSWLGLVDVAGNRVEGQMVPDAFRACPAGAILAGRPIPEHDDHPRPITVDVDPSGREPLVTVPFTGVDEVTHAMLVRIGEVMGAVANGVRYRLTPLHMQAAFEEGLTGPDLIAFLRERIDGTLPDAVRRIIERWWADFGTIRLYDSLTLIELNDDFLLREIMATSALDTAVIHTFSPRLVAVDPGSVDDVVTRLTRLGYAPRVVEGA
jgi:hypothetical protein